MLFNKKLYITNQNRWKHHHSGWGYVIDNLHDQLHNEYGTKFIDSLDDYFNNEVSDIINEPWIGVLHMPIALPEHVKQEYPLINSVSDFIKSYLWHMNKSTCRGLITLSIENKTYLENTINKKFQILNCVHPIKPSNIVFNIEKYFQDRKLASVGHWLRNFDTFFNIGYKHKKVLLKPFEDMHSKNPPSDVKVIDRMSNHDYDNLLASSVVFLNLYGASANNTIIECIVRNTPIVVNRLPAIEEYLGHDYPLFYDNIDHANVIINNDDLLIDGFKYLTNYSKEKFSVDNFISTLVKSDLYSSL